MANEKFTKRDALNAIINGEITEDVAAWAVKELEALDKSNVKNRERAAKKAEENAPLIEEIKGLLTDELQPASYFAEATGLTPPKVSALFRKMREFDPPVVRVEKIKGKSGKVNGYAAVAASEDVAAPEEDWG